MQASDEPFFLHDDSILATLLRAQRLDSIGIVAAKEIYDRQPPEVKVRVGRGRETDCQQRLSDESSFLGKRDGHFLKEGAELALLERYFVAATMKDCSLMVNCRQVRGPTVWTDGLPSSRLIRVETAGQQPLYFAVHVQVVDLDPKLPQNLLNTYKRLQRGADMVRANPRLHRPCRLPG